MAVKIVAIGKKHEDWIALGLERYEKRLRPPFDCKWVLLQHSAYDGVRAREDESGRILNTLGDKDYVILMDERGELLDSPTLAAKLRTTLNQHSSITLIIGGAFGVNSSLRDRAQLVWSLSPLVLPHQLVRLIAVEQIYRSQELDRGGSYHHA